MYDYQGDIDRFKDSNSNVFRCKFAETIFSGVGICFLCLKATIVFNVFKGLGWQTTAAAKVIERTSTVH